ncbi:PVC-type heme-binding CxxCH protein [Calycomorphotria hydatis]|uniref:NHL repeat protein n=1 Tax=Calycomorphotria hydatis TaxID=2528027 RepID=A0A517T6Z7_9PLAN|nr:PVC-type heme-binding CxxCH protein [Calycomorphotria hydatis]QDT64137.1 NHL repeat protein [Calycomorphotria hydatis]
MRSIFHASCVSCLTAVLATWITTNGAALAEDSPVDLNMFEVADDLEVTLWAASPMLYNPTNIDIDRDGRIWVAEGRNYRRSKLSPEGDRIVVLEDTNGDGKADSSHVFVQEEALNSPLGVAVIDNQIVVANAPDYIIYTDVDRNLKFDPAIDRREVLLTGLGMANHDHSLHSTTVHPSGRWLFNVGNTGSQFKDRSGSEFFIGSSYNNRGDIAGRPSTDGHVYVGAAAFTMKPDGTDVRVIGHNFRNSYEQTATSFGDVFQNDNDDPPACRTTWLMEYGNAGFASADGKRTWRADVRPGQSTPVAEWRQEDPGVMPAGDVYGGGAPCGIAYYENGALGEKHRGMLLTCESGKNVVYGYYPKPDGAGFQLERFDFLTSNPEKKFANSDFILGNRAKDRDDLRTDDLEKTFFRPSDVAIGPDGAIYVADWFDPRVGGHATEDADAFGTIYRIAPKGFQPKVPQLDLDTVEGQIAALRSPAVNVRSLGFTRLLDGGQESLAAVEELLDDKDPYIAARAIWLLPQLGEDGVKSVTKLLEDDDPQTRIAAFRSLRHVDNAVLKHAAALVNDPSPAVRREVALALRDVPFDKCHEMLVELAKQYDGADRWYLEAIGTAASGKEAPLYLALRKDAADPIQWSPAMARLAWRLHPPESVGDLYARASSDVISTEDRKLAIDALAFIKDRSAAEAVAALAENESSPELAKHAEWWLKHRSTHHWQKYGLITVDYRKVTSKPTKPKKGFDPSKLPTIEEVLALEGDVKRGQKLFTGKKAACASCHKMHGVGGQVGPELTSIGKKFNRQVIVKSLLQPSAEISIGFEAMVIVTVDGHVLTGLLVSDGDPVLLRVADGSNVPIPADQIDLKEKSKTSLMPLNPALTAQDYADLAAFIRPQP